MSFEMLKEIADELATAVKNEALDVKTFFVEAYEYETKNIRPQLLKITADCVAAAESALASSTGSEKYAFAFSNIVAAAEKDAVEFSEALIDDCIQAVIAERNKRLAAAQQPSQ